MKKILYLLLAIFIQIAGCKKENSQPSSQTTIVSNYGGKYVGNYQSQGNGVFDTINVVFNNSSYYLVHLNTLARETTYVSVSGSMITISKQTCSTYSSFFIEGNGSFINNQVKLDYKTDRSDYNPTFHQDYHLTYTKL